MTRIFRDARNPGPRTEKMHRTSSLASRVRVLTAAGFFAVPSASLGAQQALATVRQYVAQQAEINAALRTKVFRATDVASEAIEVERVNGIAEGIELWRATLPIDHSHPYLLAVLNGQVLRLGGFPAPELQPVASQLVREKVDSLSVRAQAELLTLLADANGAVQYVVAPGARSLHHTFVAAAWTKKMPPDWPRDTVLESQGGWTVRLTILSRDTRSYTLQWVPVAMAFAFDHNGRLLAWSKRVGTGFGVPGVPLETSERVELP